METFRKASMEDVNSAVAAAISRLEELKVLDGNDPKHDILFNDLSVVMEKYFNYPDYVRFN